MSRALGACFDLSGWRFVVPESAGALSAHVRNDVAPSVVAALDGKCGAPFRRSRHATTWKVRIAGSDGEAVNIFVKQLDAARGLVAAAKAKTRAKRSAHVAYISEDLRRHDFAVPRTLLIGENLATRSEVIVMSEAPGFMLTRWMNPSHHTELRRRREILHRLGAEIARLHRSGYIHGDLTPYNIFATGESPIAIWFIDHEGTEKISRVSINVARNRMRNLVQLGHFDLPGVSPTDKLRVFTSYGAAMDLSPRACRQSLSRLIKMIARRRQRDRAIKHAAAQPAIIAKEDAAAS